MNQNNNQQGIRYDYIGSPSGDISSEIIKPLKYQSKMPINNSTSQKNIINSFNKTHDEDPFIPFFNIHQNFVRCNLLNHPNISDQNEEKEEVKTNVSVLSLNHTQKLNIHNAPNNKKSNFDLNHNSNFNSDNITNHFPIAQINNTAKQIKTKKNIPASNVNTRIDNNVNNNFHNVIDIDKLMNQITIRNSTKNHNSLIYDTLKTNSNPSNINSNNGKNPNNDNGFNESMNENKLAQVDNRVIPSQFDNRDQNSSSYMNDLFTDKLKNNIFLETSFDSQTPTTTPRTASSSPPSSQSPPQESYQIKDRCIFSSRRVRTPFGFLENEINHPKRGARRKNYHTVTLHSNKDKFPRRPYLPYDEIIGYTSGDHYAHFGSRKDRDKYFSLDSTNCISNFLNQITEISKKDYISSEKALMISNKNVNLLFKIGFLENNDKDQTELQNIPIDHHFFVKIPLAMPFIKSLPYHVRLQMIVKNNLFNFKKVYRMISKIYNRSLSSKALRESNIFSFTSFGKYAAETWPFYYNDRKVYHKEEIDVNFFLINFEKSQKMMEIAELNYYSAILNIMYNSDFLLEINYDLKKVLYFHDPKYLLLPKK
ncbi:hypothetical protein TRFO_17828 [Tritrichomonas foetus]|uniref:Uncharacterized protein n=1 Tax=Tritrichomonas foetus TaxID=1144522 RepID=A0A1J4KN75_9EUKA|nr:hypothetical protein TRFO_17828 [Tritrichomonas foetus]|eukprot:OHT12352.1 hypothetical protein TRFO_17828 [Tritrichomonas foetus]